MFQNISIDDTVSGVTKVDSAASDILNRMRRLWHELLSKPTVVFNVHGYLSRLTEKMTSKSVNSCGTVS